MIRAILQAFLVFLVYRMFSNAFDYVQSILTDIMFENHFVDRYFKRIDKRRAESGMVTHFVSIMWFSNRITNDTVALCLGLTNLLPMRRMEETRNNLRFVISGPDSLECAFLKKAFVRWLVVTAVCMLIIIQDYNFYRLLTVVRYLYVAIFGISALCRF